MLTDNELKLINLSLAGQLVVVGQWWLLPLAPLFSPFIQTDEASQLDHAPSLGKALPHHAYQPAQAQASTRGKGQSKGPGVKAATGHQAVTIITPATPTSTPTTASPSSNSPVQPDYRACYFNNKFTLSLTLYHEWLSALRYGERELLVWLDHFELYAGSGSGSSAATPHPTIYLMAQIQTERSFEWKWLPNSNWASASQTAFARGEAGDIRGLAEGYWQLGAWLGEQAELRKPALAGAGTTTNLTSAYPVQACSVLACQPSSSWSGAYPALALPLTPSSSVRFGEGGAVLISGGGGAAAEATVEREGDFGLEPHQGYYYRLASAEEHALWQARREAQAQGTAVASPEKALNVASGAASEAVVAA